ncbi:MAG: VCBS repeat-containing protein, partial [Tannerella sp.]|nr:VCBS repeat-containing protein [Tannerella sp.]
WLLFVILSVVLLLIVIFQSCEQKQPAAPQLTQEQLQRKQVVDSLTKVTKILELRRDSLKTIEEHEANLSRKIIKTINADNELLVDVMLKTLVATQPRDTVSERWYPIWYMINEHIYHVAPPSIAPPLKPREPDLVIYIINFKEKTVDKVRMVNPPNTNDMRSIFLDSIAGYKREHTLTGDFDGDGRQDVFDLRDDDRSKRSKRIPFFSQETYQLPWGYFIHNEGDLDGDGADEIAFYGSIMNMGRYHVWSLKNGIWKYRLGVGLTSDMRAVGIAPVRKHPTKKGWARIRTIGPVRSSSDVVYVEEKDINLRE